MFAACHVHDGEREAWIDVIQGTFSSDDASEHVTFGARVGPVAGQADPAATAVPAGAAYSQSPFWGIKLSRDEALAHPRIDEFWEIVDYGYRADPALCRGPGRAAAPLRAASRRTACSGPAGTP